MVQMFKKLPSTEDSNERFGSNVTILLSTEDNN